MAENQSEPIFLQSMPYQPSQLGEQQSLVVWLGKIAYFGHQRAKRQNLVTVTHWRLWFHAL